MAWFRGISERARRAWAGVRGWSGWRRLPGARRSRRLLAAATVAGVVGAALVGAANLLVLQAAGGRAEEDADRLRPAQVALVPGALVRPDGSLSDMLADRVDAAAELYRAGLVDKVLVSGDHGRTGYDEVGAMRDRLLALGVPARDIFCDHAGFDTWSSAVRARKVFGVSSAIVVTQRFHLPRAIYLTRRAGIEATGFVADRRDYGDKGTVSSAREWAARVKAVGEATTNRRPRFLGPLIPIEGDGRASWD